MKLLDEVRGLRVLKRAEVVVESNRVLRVSTEDERVRRKR